MDPGPEPAQLSWETVNKSFKLESPTGALGPGTPPANQLSLLDWGRWAPPGSLLPVQYNFHESWLDLQTKIPGAKYVSFH